MYKDLELLPAMLTLLEKWGVTTTKTKSNIWHLEDLPSDTKCSHSHTGQFSTLPILLSTWGGQWPGNRGNS